MSEKSRNENFIEIMDTTLRDGEQTPGVCFAPREKLDIARCLLSRLKADRVEIASARSADSELDAVKDIAAWAETHGHLEQLEILTFIDGGKSLAWVANSGCRTVNLLAKGSEEHCRVQLRKSPQRHRDDLSRELDTAFKYGFNVNVYLEAWSQGVEDNFTYVCNMLDMLSQFPVKRIMLADTLGILTPDKCALYVKWMRSAFPELRFDFHGHNDYGMVTANSLAAVNSGINGIHTTINGLGERTGTQALAQLVVTLHDFTDFRTRIVEKELQNASRLLQALSGKRCAWNTPVIGSDVYTQTCGVHADGDRKGSLYMNRLSPERFGRQRDYALGKLSGKASIERNLTLLGLDTELNDDERTQLLAEIVRLGERKHMVSPADLPFIVSGIKKSPQKKQLQIVSVKSTSCLNGVPKATVAVKYADRTVENSANGTGSYDAFVKALKKCLKLFKLSMPKLLDYEVRIPPGGRTDALVETTITWSFSGKVFITSGVDSDQLLAAVAATEKMLNFTVK